VEVSTRPAARFWALKLAILNCAIELMIRRRPILTEVFRQWRKIDRRNSMALILIGYWVLNALGHSRRFQRCLDSGRINCVDFVNPAK
jgi:hypothetical protein